jgi:hypothetical protein
VLVQQGVGIHLDDDVATSAAHGEVARVRDVELATGHHRDEVEPVAVLAAQLKEVGAVLHGADDDLDPVGAQGLSGE